MFKFFKEWLKRALYKEKYSSDTFINSLRQLAMRVGNNCTIFDPFSTFIDPSRPYLITIGDNVQITRGVTILTHGFDWSVLKGVYGEVLGSSGGVFIGNNVFIGMQSTILKGVHIGNNVIIGANSLVNKDIPDNCVAAGNPCKVVMPLDEYYEKRKEAQVKEATELVKMYRSRYGKDPDEKALHEFYWLFSDDPDELTEVYKSMQCIGGNKEFSDAVLRKNKKQYRDMKGFLDTI